jgi:hypothetical protein
MNEASKLKFARWLFKGYEKPQKERVQELQRLQLLDALKREGRQLLREKGYTQKAIKFIMES